MTQQTRATNKSRFETGDAPSQSDYADLIDSFLSLADVSAQTIASPVIISGTLGVGGKISALSVSAPSLLATTVSASSITVTGDISASAAYFDALHVAGVEVLPAGAGAGIELYVTATASTHVSVPDTFQQIHMSAGVSAVNGVQFDASATGTVKYTGADSKRFSVNCVITAHKKGGTDRLTYVRLGKNGTTIEASEQLRTFGSAKGSFSTLAVISANQNDDIGVYLTSVASGAIASDRISMVITEA